MSFHDLRFPRAFWPAFGSVLALELVCGCSLFAGRPKLEPDLMVMTKCVTDELAKDLHPDDTALTVLADLGKVCGPDAYAVVVDEAGASSKVGSRAELLRLNGGLPAWPGAPPIKAHLDAEGR